MDRQAESECVVFLSVTPYVKVFAITGCARRF